MEARPHTLQAMEQREARAQRVPKMQAREVRKARTAARVPEKGMVGVSAIDKHELERATKVAQDFETAFCVAWALKERLNAATKKGSRLRRLMDERYRELYEADGETGHDVHVMGQKVGRYTFPTTNETPERTVTRAMAYDHDAILADDNEDFAEWLKAYVRLHIGELAERYVTETGDILDGVSVITETEPATPSVVSSEGNPYGISYDRITEALPELRQTIKGLIGAE